MTAAPKTAAAMMAADKITAAPRACEEAYMQSDAPDHRSLYFIAVWGTGGNPQASGAGLSPARLGPAAAKIRRTPENDPPGAEKLPAPGGKLDTLYFFSV